ncbi:MAG: biotin--[acetyl-CoA-carboxylase] ligase [Coriobacteriaceae bacterium]|nr:biotin--[acetyl-CoA-carboxylase] ligase [Coriobacteriaceae bacterium]
MGDTSKDAVLGALEACKGDFVSGEQLACDLGLSRNAVWKAVRSLEGSGYAIESVTGKGYRLAADCSILSRQSIERYLQSNPDSLRVEYHDNISSTNDRCKQLAEEGAPEAVLVVADQQCAGRGRQGRAFFSPGGTGVYFSLLLRPDFALEEVTFITTFAAVCATQAIEELFDVEVAIKWINDLFVDGRKVGGILTEASFDAETRGLAYVACGIGINVFTPAGGFPEDLAPACTALTDETRDVADLRSRLIAGTVDRFLDGYGRIESRPHLEEYRRRSFLTGRDVQIEAQGGPQSVHVEGIADDFSLLVKDENGDKRALRSGEVHIPAASFAPENTAI